MTFLGEWAGGGGGDPKQGVGSFMFAFDLQGRILHTSRSLDEFLSLPYRGYGADLTLGDILSTKTAEQFRQFDEEVVRTGQRVLHARCIRRAHGPALLPLRPPAGRGHDGDLQRI